MAYKCGRTRVLHLAIILQCLSATHGRVTMHSTEADTHHSPWMGYLKANLYQCFQIAALYTGYPQDHSLAGAHTFIMKCNDRLTARMCYKELPGYGSQGNLVHLHQPCGKFNVYSNINFSATSLTAIEFHIVVPKELSVNLSIHQLSLISMHEGGFCPIEVMKISEDVRGAQDMTWQSGYCGPVINLHNYISAGRALNIQVRYRKDRNQRLVSGVYQVVRSKQFKLFQCHTNVLHTKSTYHFLAMSDYPLAREKISSNYSSSIMYDWVYALTISTEPGYKLYAGVYNISTLELLKYIRFYDGPTNAYPLAFVFSGLNAIVNRSSIVGISSHGPRLHLELSMTWMRNTHPRFPFYASFYPSKISNTTGVQIVRNPSLFNATCAYKAGLAQCLWAFTTTLNHTWINITIQKMDFSALQSLHCSHGIFAVYDGTYNGAQDEANIYKSCFGFQHNMQRTLNSRGRVLWIILVSYSLNLQSHLHIEVLLSLSNCQGFPNSLLLNPDHAAFPYIIDENFMVHAFGTLFRGITTHVHWQQGCVIIQQRRKVRIKAKDQTRLMIHPPSSYVHLTYFESSLSARCRHGFVLISSEALPIYSLEHNTVKDVFVDRTLITRFLLLSIDTATGTHMWVNTDEHCEFYGGSFNVILQSECSSLNERLLRGSSMISEDIWRAVPRPEQCGDLTYTLTSTIMGVIVSQCGAFVIPQRNQTTILEFRSKLACHGRSETDLLDCRYLTYSNTSRVSVKDMCYLKMRRGCSVEIMGSFDERCPEKCVKSTNFVIKKSD